MTHQAIKVHGRPSKTTYFLAMAKLVSTRATCARRNVGCVLVDQHDFVLATGYNGNGRGQEHCITKPCEGAKYRSGEGLEKCEAIHAEQNAILQCRNTEKIKTAYITLSPCVTCVKLLLNTSCREIVYLEEYVNTDAERIWKNANRKWTPATTALETRIEVDATTGLPRLIWS
jgi:dCMP deaminase